jgi:uncharacterized protein with FMN-binding domain
MKKYFKITIVLGAFGILVLFKQIKGGNGLPQAIVGNQNNLNNTTQSGGSSGLSYKNGTYTGAVADAYYGNLQVQAVISGGKITDVIFLQYPSDNRTSQYVNSQADPMLKQEAIQVQSAQVDIVSGASASSQAFQQSLADALSQAK